VRDGNGNTYFPVDGFVIWQAAELLEGHLSLSDQQTNEVIAQVF